MTNEASHHRRNLFEVDNARNLSRQELVDTFIPTQSFWRLLSAKHHVLLGARGQGKTVMAKMLSHDHLALLAKRGDEPRALSAVVGQDFIGTYLPTRLEWVGGLKNKPWFTDSQREQLFQWRLNIASCIAFIPTVVSCIKTYVQGRANQAKTEKEITNSLSKDWLPDSETVFDELLQLRRYLEDIDYQKQIQILRERATGGLRKGEQSVGLAFGIELFAPLRQGIRQLSRFLSVRNDCTWLLCLDEAEFLEEIDHRIINSHMRAYPDNLFIKLTTMPYKHHTLATNIGVPLVHGQDFEYVNMDSDRVLTARATGDPDTIGTNFGRTLFKKLLEASEPHVQAENEKNVPNINDVLGDSEILDPRQDDWKPGSENMRMLEKYCSQETIARARRLVGTPLFLPTIARKINGPLLLRKQVDEMKGNKALTAYSGARMAIRCADDNPRHMIRIFNALRMAQPRREHRRFLRGEKAMWISPEDQTRAMRTLATSTLNQYRNFPEVGPELHSFLKMLGKFMFADLHERPLTTDQITSIKIDETISDIDWLVVRVAVGHGLLHPNVGTKNMDEMPWKEGTFHLAYALAPYFLLLPRRGKSVKLGAIREWQATSKQQETTSLSMNHNQLPLFGE